ncbi:UDP:flavonoid glycosyltransferase YjiC (YdhE family) [Kitasatospora sp. MAP12-15]|uniref:glycosyltransferase n=1 Tax=unclassified Kitasatospora TaxID=2633591 RepID=UPI002474F10C|nr:glycosyltransferase [Kitasatospora sp. MAP12-44]MDH6109740.1 UDP:flavonoid glycosyltransferase YjiC (YdhE family) [Kitasatospora sp. MAP12-44]
MRILFTSPASAGHLFPMVPTAQALRSAGHEVLFAVAEPLDVIRSSGLPITRIGDGMTVREAFEHVNNGEAAYVNVDRTQTGIPHGAVRAFAHLSESTVEGLLEAAAGWGADVLVYDSFQASAPLVAAKLKLPSLVQNFGVASGQDMISKLATEFAGQYEAHGVAGPARPISLDVVPPSLGGDGDGWRVRYVPYNGGGVVPAELLRRSERPRVVVTLGTVLTQLDGVRSIVQLAEAASTVDADFLLAVGGADLEALGTLPANVSALPWVPLAELLAGADALVHHGGSGTMMTALVAGIPQLIMPQGADHFINVLAAQRCGFALRSESADVDSELLTRLVTDAALREGAVRIQAENAAQPTPAALVANFEQLVAR